MAANPKSNDLVLGLLITLGVNVISLLWVLGGSALGTVTYATGGFQQLEGDPYAPAAAFLSLACCPALLNLGVIGAGLFRKSPRFLLGWLIGAVLSGIAGGCLSFVIGLLLRPGG